MPMREECKHFQSRTYASGEVARFCVLDLAPEAPWRCPEDCPRYERRLADAGWVHGSMVEPALEQAPPEPAGDVAHLLDEAEDVVNAVVPEARADAMQQRRSEEGPGWRRALGVFSRRGRSGSTDDDAGFGGRR